MFNVSFPSPCRSSATRGPSGRPGTRSGGRRSGAPPIRGKCPQFYKINLSLLLCRRPLFRPSLSLFPRILSGIFQDRLSSAGSGASTSCTTRRTSAPTSTPWPTSTSRPSSSRPRRTPTRPPSTSARSCPGLYTLAIYISRSVPLQ